MIVASTVFMLLAAQGIHEGIPAYFALLDSKPPLNNRIPPWCFADAQYHNSVLTARRQCWENSNAANPETKTKGAARTTSSVTSFLAMAPSNFGLLAGYQLIGSRTKRSDFKYAWSLTTHGA